MSQPVTSLEVYRARIAGKCFHNNGYFPSEIRKYISQGRLRWVELGSALFLLFSERSYEQLVIYAEGELPPECPTCAAALAAPDALPLVCNVVFRGEDDPGAARMAAFVEALGLRARYANYEYVLRDAAPGERPPLREEAPMRIGPPAPERLDEIRALWVRSQPPCVHAHLDRADMEALLASDRIRAAETPAGELCGAYYTSRQLGKAGIHYLTVGEGFRGRRVGARLVSSWLGEARDAREAFCWIERNNVRSERLFRSFGFQRSGRVSRQYVWDAAPV